MAFITSLITLVLVMGTTVTIDTVKGRIVIWIGMAFYAIVPRFTVFPAVDGEVLPVMVKSGRHPPWVCGVAGGTICWEIGSKVVGIGRLVVICLMAIYTIGRGIGIVSRGMALGTILNVVALGEREKIMVDYRWRPARIRRMAGDAVRGKPDTLVVGVLGGGVIVLMAVHTFG